jgi:hypothetical protein
LVAGAHVWDAAGVRRYAAGRWPARYREEPMGMFNHALMTSRPPGGRRAILLLGAVLVLSLVFAAPAFAASPSPHPYTGSDVLQCFSCHADKYSQWQASSPYSGGVYGTLQGHNVNAAGALLNVGHNSEELLVNDCQHCMSPFSTHTFDGNTPTGIDTIVTPISRVGPWSLVSPYAETLSVSGPKQGFYYPGDHPTDTTHGSYEGISCRVCHDVTHLDPTTGMPTLAWFNGDTWSYEAVGASTPNDLCTKCHNSDDSRSMPAASVHAGLSCIDCHMKAVAATTSGHFDHSLNAGHPGDALAQTSCGQTGCHDTPNPAGHPDVLGLDTSFKDPGRYAADPTMLSLSPDVQHNIHFITCDTCHQPVGVKSAYSVVYKAGGVAVTIAGTRTAKDLPAQNDSGAVGVYAWPQGLDPATDSGGDYLKTVGSAADAAGSAFTFDTPMLTWNTTMFVTQAVLDGDHTFPGIGRGVVTTVWVKVAATLTVSKTSVKPGTKVTLTGTVAPDKTGAKVVIQVSRNGKSWKTWKKVTLGAGSVAKATWTAPKIKGVYYFRLSYANDDQNKGNVSASKKVTVK